MDFLDGKVRLRIGNKDGFSDSFRALHHICRGAQTNATDRSRQFELGPERSAFEEGLCHAEGTVLGLGRCANEPIQCITFQSARPGERGAGKEVGLGHADLRVGRYHVSFRLADIRATLEQF